MKTIYAFLFLAFSTLLSTNLYAQNGAEAYFMGKWNATFLGTPYGDVSIAVRFEKNGTSIKGFYILEMVSIDEQKMDTVYLDGDKLNFGFSVMGNDIKVSLTKKDDNNASGLLNGQLVVEAVRVLEAKISAAPSLVETYFKGKSYVITKNPNYRALTN